MDEITNAEQLEAWLKDRPREDAVLIAARCALRAFPLLEWVIDDNAAEHLATIILPTSRALAVASAAGTWPARAPSTMDASNQAAAAGVIASLSTDTVLDGGAVESVVDGATDAADAILDENLDNAISAAANAANAVDGTNATRDAVAVFWKTVDHDANALGRGCFHEEFNETALWHTGAPDWIREPWHKLRDALLSAGDDWFVWVDWYQDRLDGKPANETLETAKALIPNEIWDAGPAKLNAEIARLINEHERQAVAEFDPASDPVDASNELTLGLADTDFQYDGETDAMVAIPFEGDAAPIDDPFRLRDRADLLSSLTDQASGLAYDLRNDPNQAPPTLARDLDRYAREARQDDPANVRVRHLETLISGLRAVLADEDMRMGLGNYLLTKLEQLVTQHDSLLAGYFAEAVNAVREAKSHTLPEGTTPEQLDENLERANELITGEEWRVLPSPPVDYPDELEAQRLALREMASTIDLKAEGEERNRQIKMVQDGYVTATATVSRLIGKTLRAAGGGNRFAGAANITTVSMAAIALLKVLLGTLGLPI